jgi:hypothetical protein
MWSGNFRVTIARYALGLATSFDLVEAADAALTRGVYSYSLGELATMSSPTMADAGPMFAAALGELEIPLPSRKEAARVLALVVCSRLVEGSADGVWEVLRKVCDWSEGDDKLDRALSEECELRLKYFFYSYDNFTEPEVSDWAASGLAELHADLVQEATKWIRERGGVRVDPSWLRWNDGTVLKIARGIADERAFDRLSILHDALIDAGCDNEDILAHLREPGKHATRCWVVDLLLGIQ